GLLHGVLRLAERAEHPVGHRPQVGPLRLEPLRQLVVLVHRSHSLAPFRHLSDERNPADVTRSKAGVAFGRVEISVAAIVGPSPAGLFRARTGPGWLIGPIARRRAL